MEKLASSIVRAGPLPPDDAVGWIARLVQSLAIIHVHGRAHGRISARAIETLGRDCVSAGFYLDTADLADDVGYHSPDRITGGRASPQDDVWALGVLLYFLLTGHMPFAGASADEVRATMLADQIDPLATYGITDPRLQRLVDELLAWEPAKRVRTVQGLRARLQQAYPHVVHLPPLKLGKPSLAFYDDADEEPDDDGQKLTALVRDDPDILRERVAHAARKAAARQQAGADDAAALPMSDEATRPAPDAHPVGEQAAAAEPPRPAVPSGPAPPLMAVAAKPPAAPPAAARVRTPALARTPVAAKAPAALRPRDYLIALLLVVLGGAAGFLALRSRAQSAPTAVASTDPAVSSSASRTAGAATATATSSRAMASATATTTAGATAGATAGRRKPPPVHGVSACVQRLFPPETFAELASPNLSFVCVQTDSRKGAYTLRTYVTRGGARRGMTDGMKEWAMLGWYELAVLAVARGACCERPLPLRTVPTPRGCQMDEALERLGSSVLGPDDAAVQTAIQGFQRAVACIARAGAGELYGQKTEPAPGALSAFERFLARARTP